MTFFESGWHRMQIVNAFPAWDWHVYGVHYGTEGTIVVIITGTNSDHVIVITAANFETAYLEALAQARALATG